MTVAAVASTLSLERDGQTFYFCSEGCRTRFEAHKEHVPTAG
jgi:YHS domain-containing protein